MNRKDAQHLYEEECETLALSWDLGKVPPGFYQRYSMVSVPPLTIPPGTKVRVVIERIDDE